MKIKSARVLGVVMTLMLVASLVVGIPLSASAGTQAWSTVTVPGATGLVIADADIGPVMVASDGTIYVAALAESGNNIANDAVVDALFDGNTAGTYTILKSTDKGQTFSVTGLKEIAGPIVAIVGSPQFPGTLYVATPGNLYKSIDAGVTFPAQYLIPLTYAPINSLDVTIVGAAHMLVIGTSAGAEHTVATLDETILVPVWTSVGDPAFGKAVTVAFSKNFATDRQLVGVVTVGAAVRVASRFGTGAWGVTIGNAVLPVTAAGIDTAVIAFPSDYSSAAGSNFFYVGVRDPATLAASGVYFIAGAAAPTASTATLRLADNLRSLAVSGAAASATLFVGSADANHVHRSTSAGASWAAATKAPTGAMDTYVAVASDFATSNMVYAAVSGPEGAFSVSAEGGQYFNQWALIDTAIVTIDQLALAGANTLFMVTSAPPTVIPAIPAVTEQIRAVVTTAFANGAGPATYTIDTNLGVGTGTLTVPQNAVLGTSIPVILTGPISDVTGVTTTATGNHQAGVFDLVGNTTGTVFGTVMHSAVFTPTFTDGALPSEPLAVSVTTVFTAPNVYSLGYINQAGAAAAGTVTITGPGTGTVTLAGGDTGVRDVTSSSLVLDMASITGVFDLVGTLTGTIYSTTNLVGILTDGAMIADAASAVVTTTLVGGSGPLTFTVTYVNSAGATATTGTISIPVNSVATTSVALGVSVNNITGIAVTSFGGHTAGAFAIRGTTTYATVGALATESVAGVYSGTFVDNPLGFNAPTPAVTTYPNSVWRTANALLGGGWARIALELPIADIPTVVGPSGAYATDNTAFSATGLVVKKSTNANAAASFTAVPTALALNANVIHAVDPSTVHIGTAGGTVVRTTNAGLDWPSANVAGVVTSLALSGANMLAGNNAGSVYLSTNSGSSFRQLTGAAVGAGNTYVAFDSGFATNKMVYASSSGATGIVRVTAGTSATTDVAATIGAVGTDSHGIVAIAGPTGQPDTLYVADSTADTAPARSINPNATAPAFELTGSNTAGAALPGTTATLEKMVGMVTASNTLWAIDDTGDTSVFPAGTGPRVLAFTDTLAIQPAAGTSVATSPTSAVVSWPAVPNAATYTVTVTAPFGALIPVVTLGAGANITSAGITGMTTGAAYTFTVNVATPDLSYKSAAAPLTTQPGPPPWDPSQNALGTIDVAPDGGATGVSTTPTLQWNSSAIATGFELIVSRSNVTDASGKLTTSEVVNKTGASAIAGANSTTYTFTTALANNATYYWQVRAVMGTSFSPWSAVFAFTTAPLPPPVVTPTTTTTSVIISIPPAPPATTITLTQPPATTTIVTQPPATTTVITVTQPPATTITIPPPPAQPTPSWVWAIIAIGGVLLVVVIVLIARTRKV